ncbi:MAG TPA: crotonase/enoyl-CoA hydratase family protein [Casimicrobiaceae bacterium]|nr:crotonase/enoyl-CoA hydratase family protein [Casimicrobiaceae bacterium]
MSVTADAAPKAEVRFLPHIQFPQVATRYDVEYGVLWGYMNPRPRPSFNSQLLTQLRGYIDSITADNGFITHRSQQYRVSYAVIASKIPGVFNLGGDLAMFRDAIDRHDRAALIAYGVQCVDNLFPWSRNCDLPLTTISLVQGDALGGGFECALASSVLIAEESARMGFPEILFNLFPGMGAYSFLLRKIGRRLTEELISSGNTYTARQLYDMGVVDVLAMDGDGEAAVYSYIRKHAKSANGRRGIEQVRGEITPITREELLRVVGVWADAALRLSDRDLRMMERLVRAQSRNTEVDDYVAAPVATVTPLQRVV